MKLTRHNGRSGKHGTYNPRHNDRRFDVENSEHIDAERARQNVYWDCYRGFTTHDFRENPEQPDFSFEEIERMYYYEHYVDHVNAQNAVQNRQSRQISLSGALKRKEVSTLAYVPVPKDLTKVKTKVMFNLTKRQLICFTGGALIGVPLFFLLRKPTGNSVAAMCMMLVMLFSKVRTGQVRVLLGSTAKMGAGTNVQDRLVALHDLDCPWRPGDVGRILRTFKIKKNVEVTDNGKDNF